MGMMKNYLIDKMNNNLPNKYDFMYTIRKYKKELAEIVFYWAICIISCVSFIENYDNITSILLGCIIIASIVIILTNIKIITKNMRY